MKRQALMILTTLSFLVMLTATSVQAQSDLRLKVNIPFEFSVGHKVLPAGEYTVGCLIQGILVIRSEDRRAVQTFSISNTQASHTRNETSLVFNQYGDQYFLATIWTAGTDTGQELRESRAERELRARRSLASARGESGRETVSIIAHR